MNIRAMVDVFKTQPNVKVIVMTGGPCGGKSTFLSMAIAMLARHGFTVFVVPEQARELITAGFIPGRTLAGEQFQEMIFGAILQHESAFFEALRHVQAKKIVVFADRGLVDGCAYVGQEAFSKTLASYGIALSQARDRYHAVVALVTAAHGAETHYRQDDQRFESPAEARALCDATIQAWMGHPHLSIVDNSTDFPTKMNRALAALGRVLNIPMATEIERKFRVENHGQLKLPSEFTVTDIEQIYLVRNNKPGIECRIRKAVALCGTTTYYYTEKTQTKSEGVRGEFEQQINADRYSELRTHYEDINSRPIHKRRYTYRVGSRVFELDVYERHLHGLVILEVEFPTEDEARAFVLPPEYRVTEVTGDRRFKNRELARTRTIPE